MSRPLPDKTRALLSCAAFVLASACAGEASVAPGMGAARASVAMLPTQAETRQTLATLRRATARYHDLNAAIADGFVFLHGCEVRPGEGAVGTVYAHLGRLMDGGVDATLPEALVYEPARNAGEPPVLVAVELAIPFALWSDPAPPTFLGAEFQPEDEFGVYGLHVWLWRHNPEGLFSEANPRVSCGAE